ncbi:MAG: type IV pilus twitching motility protein PilT [Actinomycetota bacterium]
MPKTTQQLIERHLASLWELGGTDLLLTPGCPPLARVDGEMGPLEGEPALAPQDTARMADALLTPEQSAALTSEREVDFSFAWRDLARFRGNCFHTRGEVAVTLRLIPREIPSPEVLGLPAAVSAFARLHQGLVLVTGPTGSGKTTTLASVIDWVNKNRACHIVTLEDPIEYLHEPRMAAVSQREIGTDSLSFARGLRSALREDPDVLLVGEMRDTESIQTTLTIAETGHLVFATLHTNDAAQALDRIVDVFPAENQDQVKVQLAGSLAGVVSQRLLPRVDGGRVAAFEVLVATHAVRNLIKEGKTRQIRNVILTGRRQGMRTLENSLTELVERGLVSYEEAVSRSLFPDEVHRRPPSGQPAMMAAAATANAR